MASKEQIAKTIASIKTLYPYYAKDTDVSTLYKLWNGLLKDYTDREVSKGLLLCLQKCKMPPTPADIIDEIAVIKAACDETPLELWDKFDKALDKVDDYTSRFNYTAIGTDGKTSGQRAREELTAVFESLSPRIKEYVKTQSEFVRISQMSLTSRNYERDKFIRALPEVDKRLKTQSIYKELYGDRIKQLSE